jgi:hypothetical protein
MEISMKKITKILPIITEINKKKQMINTEKIKNLGKSIADIYDRISKYNEVLLKLEDEYEKQAENIKREWLNNCNILYGISFSAESSENNEDFVWIFTSTESFIDALKLIQSDEQLVAKNINVALSSVPDQKKLWLSRSIYKKNVYNSQCAETMMTELRTFFGIESSTEIITKKRKAIDEIITVLETSDTNSSKSKKIKENSDQLWKD